MISTILLGTTNRKKIIEMRPLLEPLGYSLVDLSAMPDHVDVAETGNDFIENARLKAITYATRYRTWAIGEDSGLCVPALGGAPGIYSARFARLSQETDSSVTQNAASLTQDEANNALLLERLSNAPTADRSAYYVSTMVLASPEGESIIEAAGECWGRIVSKARGIGGFGYDPLFEVIEYHKTFAELGPSVKNALSHRGRALAKFLRLLVDVKG
ncbi:MAG: RdgB/HAM1 family non-canonical purine NTP pyrophosphatase [Planctomycetota bacterium]|nr:RdgB/HAM1 family non-canonical purine NTP pyrophosphatase [Planctomycetota bacterium]